jgi:hypothetical protein
MKLRGKVIYWLPRVICILAICFVSLFAFDVFSPRLTIWQQLFGLFLHLIPSFILITILAIAWKWEFLGGIIFTLIGMAMSPFIFLHNRNVNHFPVKECIFDVLMITFPFIVVGILFLFSYFIRKKELKNIHSMN